MSTHAPIFGSFHVRNYTLKYETINDCKRFFFFFGGGGGGGGGRGEAEKFGREASPPPPPPLDRTLVACLASISPYRLLDPSHELILIDCSRKKMAETHYLFFSLEAIELVFGAGVLYDCSKRVGIVLVMAHKLEMLDGHAQNGAL